MAQIDSNDGSDINADQSADNAPRFLLNYSYQSGAGSVSESDQENFSAEEDRRKCDGDEAPKKKMSKKVLDGGGKGKNGKGKGSTPSGKKTGKGSGVVKRRVQKKKQQKKPPRKSIKRASPKAGRRPPPSDKQSASLSHEIDVSSLNDGKVEDDWQHLSLRQTARLYIENVYISN